MLFDDCAGSLRVQLMDMPKDNQSCNIKLASTLARDYHELFFLKSYALFHIAASHDPFLMHPQCSQKL
jgi:hypothetical protein